MKQRRFEVLVLLLALIGGSYTAQADETAKLKQVIAVGNSGVKAGQASQKRVDSTADKTDTVFQEFKGVAKQVRDLKIYNKQLDVQIERQEQRLVELEQSIKDATVMNRQMAPLTNRMLDALSDFVTLDMPFHMEERQERIARLRENMTKDNFSIAEKFRQVLEGYKIEITYGRTMDSYTDTVNVNGEDMKVDVLRVGRIALMFQTSDGSVSGYWDNAARKWEYLDGAKARNAIKQGIKITNKQASVEVISLPITAPTAAK